MDTLRAFMSSSGMISVIGSHVEAGAIEGPPFPHSQNSEGVTCMNLCAPQKGLAPKSRARKPWGSLHFAGSVYSCRLEQMLNSSAVCSSAVNTTMQ